MQIALKSGNNIAIQAAQKLSEQATAQLETVIEKQKKTVAEMCCNWGEMKENIERIICCKEKKL